MCTGIKHHPESLFQPGQDFKTDSLGRISGLIAWRIFQPYLMREQSGSDLSTRYSRGCQMFEFKSPIKVR